MRPKNSRPIHNKITAVYTKTKTNQNTEWIGLVDDIAIIAVNIKRKENIKNNCSIKN